VLRGSACAPAPCPGMPLTRAGRGWSPHSPTTAAAASARPHRMCPRARPGGGEAERGEDHPVEVEDGLLVAPPSTRPPAARRTRLLPRGARRTRSAHMSCSCRSGEAPRAHAQPSCTVKKKRACEYRRVRGAGMMAGHSASARRARRPTCSECCPAPPARPSRAIFARAAICTAGQRVSRLTPGFDSWAGWQEVRASCSTRGRWTAAICVVLWARARPRGCNVCQKLLTNSV
jgi:hypothetical protein